MCTSIYIKYTCNCEKEMEFVQCAERQGTNVRCARATRQQGKFSANYCRAHLVKPNAPVKYYDQNGQPQN